MRACCTYASPSEAHERQSCGSTRKRVWSEEITCVIVADGAIGWLSCDPGSTAGGGELSEIETNTPTAPARNTTSAIEATREIRPILVMPVRSGVGRGPALRTTPGLSVIVVSLTSAELPPNPGAG